MAFALLSDFDSFHLFMRIFVIISDPSDIIPDNLTSKTLLVISTGSEDWDMDFFGRLLFSPPQGEFI